MGTLLLLRQVGGAVALASAETVFRSTVHDHSPAVATGIGVLTISLARLGDRRRRDALAPPRGGPSARAAVRDVVML